MKNESCNEKLRGNSWGDYIRLEVANQFATDSNLNRWDDTPRYVLPIIGQRSKMNKYKVLHFGRCYTNTEGDIRIMLVDGNQKEGYVGIIDCQHPAVMFHRIYLGSRVVLNDGTWKEIDKSSVSEASKLTGNYGKQMGQFISPLIELPHFDFGLNIFSPSNF